MKGRELWAALLQEAISGRLVEQRDEEPEVQQIDAPPEDAPFEIPGKWKWGKLETLGKFISGWTPKPAELTGNGGIPYFKVADMNIPGNEKFLRITKQYLISSNARTFPQGAIVYPKNGGAVFTNKRRVLVKESVVDLNTGGFIPGKLLEGEFIFHILNSLDFRKISKGTALPTIDQKRLKSYPIPVPPLEEQRRIVAKLEALRLQVDEYTHAEERLSTLTAALPDRLRASILQEAIQGKLVPQLDDEPAVQAIGEPPEDVPFEIPGKWKWVQLGNLLNIISGTGYSKKDERKSGVRIIRGGNIRNFTITLNSDDVFISNDLYDENKIIQNDDIVIVASTGSKEVIGRPGIYLGNEKLQIGAFLRILRPKDKKTSNYLRIILQTDYYRNHIRKLVKGTNINNIKNEYINRLFIPLPPLEEQHRIVAKLEQILPEIGKLAT